ncbi:hypothetical protein [Nocardioides hwasunensis]|uniref:Uncharacterized protein n=1 Tax=Nocardioides hwasunensis TaxID=397258 RepID=A0ABR8MF96_9ACTN|nr:hypothetical protein [Nocardioides hwasunensis]MBD3914769.1 hypothetical protein [Nocardioides hwasunensis]
MSESPSLQSPYLLPPGLQRRQMMQRMGIRPCSLDYDDAEWAAIEAEATRLRGASTPTATSADDDGNGSVEDAVAHP